jgi:hypothetical protein
MNRAQRVIAFLEQRPNTWIRATEFEPVGGRQAWRTAIAEARLILQQRGADIEWRGTPKRAMDGSRWTLSEYRYKPQPKSLLDIAS